MSRRALILIVFCLLVASLFTTACSRKNQGSDELSILPNPVSPASEGIRPKSPKGVPKGISASLEIAPNRSGDNLALLATATSLNDPGHGPSNANDDQFWTGFQSGRDANLELSWETPVTINRLFIAAPYSSGQHLSRIFTDAGLVEIGSGLFFSHLSTWVGPVDAIDLSFPAVETKHLAIEYESSWGDTRIDEVEAYGSPSQILKITSPTTGSTFGNGQPVPFVCEVNWPIIPGAWGWYKMPNWEWVDEFGQGAANVTKSDFPPGDYAFYFYGQTANGRWYSDYVYPVTITPGGGSSLKITSPAASAAFDYGQQITFTGEVTGTVTDLKWTSDGVDLSQPLTFTKADIPPGNHVITLAGQSAGFPVSDSITITIGEPAKIKIKNLDAQSGDEYPEDLVVSYRKAKTRFQAIGCLQNGTPVGPVPVVWSLDGGDVATDTMRAKILTELGVNVGKIGVFETPTGAAKEVSADQVTFVSYLPSMPTDGNIRVVANRGSKREVSIRIKQPTVYLSVKHIQGLSRSPGLIISMWIQTAKTIWGQEGLIDIQEPVQPFAIENITFEALPREESGEFLLLREPFSQPPSFLNPIISDALADRFYGVGDPNSVIPRQSEEMFKRRVINENVVNMYVSDLFYDVVFEGSEPDGHEELTKFDGGIALFLPGARRRSLGQIEINDKIEGGVLLPLIGELALVPEMRESEENILAHELGHVLLHRGQSLDHLVPESTPINVMHKLYPGKSISPEQIKIIFDYDKQKDPNSFFIVEN